MPNLGNSTPYANETSGGSGFCIGQKFQMPEAGTLTDFYWYGFGSGATYRMRFAVYTDEATMNRVWGSDEIVPASNDGVTPAWTHVSGASGSLSSGAWYWLVWNSNDSDPHFYYNGSGNYPYYDTMTYGEFPATLARPSTAWSYANVNVYIEYSTGGGSVDVTPEPTEIAGTGSQVAPVVLASGLYVPDHIAQGSALVDPTIDTTQNLGVGNYRSTTVLMNW